MTSANFPLITVRDAQEADLPALIAIKGDQTALQGFTTVERQRDFEVPILNPKGIDGTSHRRHAGLFLLAGLNRV